MTSGPAHAQQWSTSTPVCYAAGLVVPCGAPSIGVAFGPVPSGSGEVVAICSTPCPLQGVAAEDSFVRPKCSANVTYTFQGGAGYTLTLTPSHLRHSRLVGLASQNILKHLTPRETVLSPTRPRREFSRPSKEVHRITTSLPTRLTPELEINRGCCTLNTIPSRPLNRRIRGQMKSSDDILLRVADVAGQLGIAERTVRLWAECGEIHAVKMGRQRRFSASEIDKIKSNGHAGPTNISLSRQLRQHRHTDSK